MPVTVPAVGTVESLATIQIRAQVTGQLSTVHFAEGQEVKRGDPLFTLDQRPFRSALAQAEAVLARDTATFKNAQLQESRTENLSQRGLISRDQYDSAHANAAALAATIEADKAAVETARVNLQYTEIKAPVDGRTGVLGVHVGDLVRSSDTAPLVVINQLAPIYVTFSVPGRLLNDIRRYQAQRPLGITAVASSSLPTSAPGAPGVPAAVSTAQVSDGATEQGVLAFIDNMVDASTGTIRLKGTFPNGDRQLWPGAFVQVTLHVTTETNAVVVPAIAVQASQDGQFVYVVKADRTVEMRPVQTQRQQGDEMVIANGIAAGDIVVTDGHLRLAPGSKVMERGEPAGSGSRSGPGGRGGAADGARQGAR